MTESNIQPAELITIVILTKNEEKMLAALLKLLTWCPNVLVVDTGSSDNTVNLAKKAHARVIELKLESFAEIRTRALEFVDTPWVFYLDADERANPALVREILVNVETNAAPALTIKRQNIFYGQKMTAGGWQNDQVTRVFRLAALRGWMGRIHESPRIEGEAKLLKHSLIHLTHRNTVDGLLKSAAWTPIEAELLTADRKTPQVTFKLVLKKAMAEFVRRAFLKKGYRDGMVGWIEALVQAFNRALVYIQVWERQQVPKIEEKYELEEERLFQAWLNEKL